MTTSSVWAWTKSSIGYGSFARCGSWCQSEAREAREAPRVSSHARVHTHTVSASVSFCLNLDLPVALWE